MGKLAVTCMVEEAKLFGVNKPADVGMNPGTLSLDRFLEAVAEHVIPRRL